MGSFRMGGGIVLLPLMLLLLVCGAYAQNCGCSSDLCCSKYGYCGSGDDYCGSGCQQGPCYSNANYSGNRDGSVSPIVMLLEFNEDGSVSSIITKYDTVDSGSSIVTRDFFDKILAGADGGHCAGKNFYTYEGFVNAANAYSGFGTTGSSDVAKRELAAFFAHVTHATGSFCYIEEIDGAQKDYCDETNTQYPCVSGKGYFGRGPIQLSWNLNYGPAGKDIGFDGLNEPEKVAQDETISFKTAVWYWMKQSDCHNAITSGRGFGDTIQAVNGALECNGGNPEAVNSRINYYRKYCTKLGVDPGGNVSC